MPIKLDTEFDVERTNSLAKRLSGIEASIVSRLAEARNLVRADMETVDELKPQFSPEGQAAMGARPECGHAWASLLERFVADVQAGTADYAAWAKALNECSPGA